MISQRRLFRVLFFLAATLSLTHCGSKLRAPTQTFQAGFNHCDGGIGQFDVILSKSQTYVGNYELKVVAITNSAQPNDKLRIAIANKTGDVKDLTRQVSWQMNTTVFQGYLTPNDINLYQAIAIAPDDGSNTNFLDLPAANDALCNLPTTDANNQTPLQ